MKRPPRLYTLQRPKLRQSWNKYNLYNMARFLTNFKKERYRTYFQQKFSAKAMTRAYHGENVLEREWRTLFSRRLFTAVEMPPSYLARYDGSEQGAGRGSGQEVRPGETPPSALNYSWYEAERIKKVASKPSGFLKLGSIGLSNPKDPIGNLLEQPTKNMTPYMQVMYWPLERRLDTAIFRALFASSVRQARQFVVHGAVKVNGIKMNRPEYLLNPGDMFQVDIDKVMYATGQPRTPDFNASEKQDNKIMAEELGKIEARIRGRRAKEARAETKEDASASPPVEASDGEEAVAAPGAVPKTQESSMTAENGRSDLSSGRGSNGTVEKEHDPEFDGDLDSIADVEEREKKRQRRQISALVKSARTLLSSTKTEVDKLTAKDKQELRLFRHQARKAMSMSTRQAYDPSLVDRLEQQLKRFTVEDDRTLKKAEEGAEGVAAETSTKEPTPGEVAKLPDKERAYVEGVAATDGLTRDELRHLVGLLKTEGQNPANIKKPYVTPWAPRPYLSAFAFIPRYLEVNQNICAAVYLRHPVARRGMGEVPTPFPYEVNQLAHSWYIRKR